MNNKEQLIDAYKEIIKNLSVEELKDFYDDVDQLQVYEEILLSMPKKALMETFRVALFTSLLNWIEFDALHEEELQDLIQYMTQKKEK